MAGSGIAAPKRLEDEFYRIMRKFNNKDWLHFARSKDGLALPDYQIDDIQQDYSHDAKEQKYQMLTVWKTRNNSATIDHLIGLVDRFLNITTETSNEPTPNFNTTTSVQSHALQQLTTVLGQLLNTGHLAAGVATHATNISEPASSIPNLEQRFSGPPVAHIPQPAAVSGQPGAPISPVQVEQNPCFEVHQVTVRQSTLEQNQKILQEHENLYQMNYNKGLAVIINNNFGGERVGARLDFDHMKVMWTQLGCEIIPAEDKTRDQIRKILRGVANKTEKFNYLAIVVMSHGGMKGKTEVISDCEGNPLSVKEILFQFENAQSPNWEKKPKCFFFQFCRGVIIDKGIDPNLDNVFSSLRYQNELNQADDINNRQCAISDMFISYATLSGYKAYRNSRGSWFINAITNIFMENAYKEHLSDLMIKVRKAVSDETGLIIADDGSTVPCKEMSESVDRLRMKLFLLLKTGSNQQNPQS